MLLNCLSGQSYYMNKKSLSFLVSCCDHGDAIVLVVEACGCFIQFMCPYLPPHRSLMPGSSSSSGQLSYPL